MAQKYWQLKLLGSQKKKPSIKSFDLIAIIIESAAATLSQKKPYPHQSAAAECSCMNIVSGLSQYTRCHKLKVS